MDYQIKLRRLFSYEAGYNTYVEEVSVSPDGSLAYRRSSGGKCQIGKFPAWEGEDKVFPFMLGFVPSEVLASHLRQEVAALPSLEPLKDHADYEPEFGDDLKENYGSF